MHIKVKTSILNKEAFISLAYILQTFGEILGQLRKLLVFEGA